jgi:hypothetical protein
VQVRTEKPQFLAGEPVFVLVEVKNVGTEQVACDGASVKPPLEMSVENGERRVMKALTGCERETDIGRSSGITTHPPMLQPGRSTTFRHLLRGYRLKPERTSFGSGAQWTSGGASPIPTARWVRREPRSNDRLRNRSRERPSIALSR